MAFWSNEYKHSMRGIFPPVAADIIKEKFLAAGFDPAGVSDEHENIINEIYSWGAYSPMDKFDDKESLDFSNAPAEYRVRLAGSALANIDNLPVYGTPEGIELTARLMDMTASKEIVVVKAVSSWDNGAEFPHNVYFNTETGEVDISHEELEKISGQDSNDLYIPFEIEFFRFSKKTRVLEKKSPIPSFYTVKAAEFYG